MAKVQGHDYPEHLLYDVENQIWYEPLSDTTIRTGFTPLAVSLAGEVLVFTPKRIGRDFEKGRSFATIECGKWIGSARAAFEGVVISQNDDLIRKPGLLNIDSFGKGWMLVVQPNRTDWNKQLVTGATIAKTFETWLASESYKDRSE